MPKHWSTRTRPPDSQTMGALRLDAKTWDHGQGGRNWRPAPEPDHQKARPWERCARMPKPGDLGQGGRTWRAGKIATW
jgi:hypothetical protein